MKQITLIRHAKSSWDNTSWDDIERPLKTRGINDANLMSKILIEKGIIPDHIVCSPAVRAQQTCNIFIENMNLKESIKTIHKSIYFEGVQAIINTFKKVDNTYNHVFLFGHQPYVAALNQHLTGEGDHHIPTTGVCHISLPIDNWQEISPEIGESVFVISPKLFK